MSENHFKPIEKLTFSDNGMFQEVMRDPEICKELVESLLHIKINHIEYPELEKVIAPFYTTKGVRLDVYLKDTDKVIDIEIQAYTQIELGKRTRYYQSMIDMDCLMKGQDYPSLKDSYILFICKNEPFKDENKIGYGLPCYRFINTCQQNPQINLNDKAYKIIYNASAYAKEKDEKIRAFLHFIKTNEPGNDDFSNRISSIVENIKHNKEFRRIYAAMNLHDRDLIREATKEGENKKAIASAKNLLQMNVLSPEQISQAIELPLEKVLDLQKEVQ